MPLPSVEAGAPLTDALAVDDGLASWLEVGHAWLANLLERTMSPPQSTVVLLPGSTLEVDADSWRVEEHPTRPGIRIATRIG